jgi:hypothetical protein
MLRRWLDTWSGNSRVLDAMSAASYHVELRQSVFGWRAEFHREAMQHSLAKWAGVGTDVLPWRAVQVRRWICCDGRCRQLSRQARVSRWGLDYHNRNVDPYSARLGECRRLRRLRCASPRRADGQLADEMRDLCQA